MHGHPKNDYQKMVTAIFALLLDCHLINILQLFIFYFYLCKYNSKKKSPFLYLPRHDCGFVFVIVTMNSLELKCCHTIQLKMNIIHAHTNLSGYQVYQTEFHITYCSLFLHVVQWRNLISNDHIPMMGHTLDHSVPKYEKHEEVNICDRRPRQIDTICYWTLQHNL